jgi:hypothetical protein
VSEDVCCLCVSHLCDYCMAVICSVECVALIICGGGGTGCMVVGCVLWSNVLY